jgi:hypothetical protein
MVKSEEVSEAMIEPQITVYYHSCYHQHHVTTPRSSRKEEKNVNLPLGVLFFRIICRYLHMHVKKYMPT